MGDPREGLTTDGAIRTGADRSRIPRAYEPALGQIVSTIVATDSNASVYVYGSVATGMARTPTSDIDVLTVGLDPVDASEIGRVLSERFADLCRGVEVGAAGPADLDGEGDPAYGLRAFVHHYCVHLAGPDVDRLNDDVPGDARTARGFNGDIAAHARRWRTDLRGGTDPTTLGRRVARKTLLAVAGLVSVHDADWTTDRSRAARRWAEVHPKLADGLDELFAWATDDSTAEPAALADRLDATVDPIVRQFAERIGLWPTDVGPA